jgi:hypothetical protein
MGVKISFAFAGTAGGNTFHLDKSSRRWRAGFSLVPSIPTGCAGKREVDALVQQPQMQACDSGCDSKSHPELTLPGRVQNSLAASGFL